MVKIKEVIQVGVENLFRKLLLALCDFVYSGIPGLYKTFYALASAELFSADEIQKFASNIYILISVIMLFAFGDKQNSVLEFKLYNVVIFANEYGYTNEHNIPLLLHT